MDSHVREILASIDVLKIRDDTIVVFPSDNGPEADLAMARRLRIVARLLLYAYGKSLRTPFIIRWPGAYSRWAREQRDRA
jgi:arylsulfatase A-like enzyme